MIGELYSAHSNQFIPGFSLWAPEDIESGKCVLWHPESSLSFGKDMSIDDISKMLSFKASISGSFAAGLLKISGSAKYLAKSKVLNNSTLKIFIIQFSGYRGHLKSDLNIQSINPNRKYFKQSNNKEGENKLHITQ